MNVRERENGWRRYRLQLAISGGLLLFGLLGMVVLAAMRRSPAEVKRAEKALRVDGVRLETVDFPVVLTGYGAVRPLRVVGIAAEVAGIVTEVHPSLRVGEAISSGDLLFAIDDRDYRGAEVEASAMAEQSRQTIQRLEEELRHNRKRMETVKRNHDLAQREFDRVLDLFERHQIGSQAELDVAERALNTAKDIVDELEKHLAVAPLLITEAQSARKASEARLDRAHRQLDRCNVRSPFDARVVRSLVEKGLLVHAAVEMVVLADDSVLEISVPLDARQAHQRLQFKSGRGEDLAWFSEVEPVECKVRWTEAPETHQWTGVLHRVEQMSVETRTLRVVVRIEGGQADNARGFPLVEGMFCSVEIPGRTLHEVYRAPRWALSFDDTVYLAANDRLVTRPVRVAYIHKEEVLIDQGLEEGEVLIVTRLGNPLENALLDLNLVEAEAAIP